MGTRSATDPAPPIVSAQDILSTGATNMNNKTDVMADTAALRAEVDAIAAANGIATAMARHVFEEKKARIFVMLGAKSAEERSLAEKTLCYYFAVHGTSPETQWANYGHPVVFQGKRYPPADIVGIIGQGNVKQFMARYTSVTMQMFAASETFQSALMDRAVKAGLTSDSAVYAIDFLGKDASLDYASVGKKTRAKQELLRNRAGNVDGIHELRRRMDASNASDRPPVTNMPPPAFSTPAR